MFLRNFQELSFSDTNVPRSISTHSAAESGDGRRRSEQKFELLSRHNGGAQSEEHERPGTVRDAGSEIDIR